jgi:hypothetical protein
MREDAMKQLHQTPMSHVARRLLPTLRVVLLSALLGASGFALAAPEEWIYTVAPGDTLSRIAENHLDQPDAWRELQKLNKVADPNRLKPGMALRIPTALSGSAPFAEAAWVKGAAQRLSSGAAAPLVQGAQLRMGETLLTGADGSVTLRFADQSRVLVAPNSRLTLTHLLRPKGAAQGRTMLTLEAGAAESVVTRTQTIEARYEIKTPTLSLAVRGTRFRVMVDSQTGMTRTTVSEGEVAASAQGKTVAVNAGQGTMAARGEAPAAARGLLSPPVIGDALAVVESLPTRFTWPTMSGARQYRIELLDREGLRQMDELQSVDALARWANLADGDYQLRVRAIDESGLEGLPSVHAFVVNARPESPMLRQPLDGARLQGEKTSFRWARVSSVPHYRLQVSDTPEFVRFVAQIKQLPGASGGIDLALPPGKYFWRIAAGLRDGTFGPESAVQSFDVVSRTSDSPVAAADKVTLAWKRSPRELKYQVQVALDASFGEPIHDALQTASLASFTAKGKGPYFVRLRRIDADGLSSDYEATQQFTLTATP